MVYPSINFKTSKRFPVPSTVPWRDSIAVVGEFAKGPAEVIKITGENFELYFGSDSTEGSANVQQMLELGATNIWVSRAVPQDTPSTGSIYVASGNTNSVEPIVGYEVDSDSYNAAINETSYTTGISLQIEYIGDPIVNRTLLTKVTTLPTDLEHPNFTDKDEQGEVIFTVVEFKDGETTPTVKHDDTKSITLKAVANDIDKKQVVAISKTDGAGNDISDVDQVIQPGYVFKGKQGLADVELLILSKPFTLADGKWGVLVENLTATAATPNVTDVQVFDPEVPLYVVGYKTNIIEAGSVTTRTPNTSYLSLNTTYTDNVVVEDLDSLFVVKALDGGVYKEFKYDIVADAVVNAIDAFAVTSEGFHPTASEGIQLCFGEFGDITTPIAMRVGGQFSVLFANGYAIAGGLNASSPEAFTIGTKGKNVMSALYTAMNNSTVMGALTDNLKLVGTYFPYGVIFDTTLKGIESTRLKYKLDRHTSGPATEALDLYFNVNKTGYKVDSTIPEKDLGALSYQYVSGGYDGPSYSETDFFGIDGTPLLKVQALSPGVQNIKLTLNIVDNPSVDNGQYVLRVDTIYNNKPYQESIRLDTRSINPENGLFTQSKTSAFVRVYFTPYLEYSQEVLTAEAVRQFTSKAPIRVNPPLAMKSEIFTGKYGIDEYGPKVLRDVPLAGGKDYSQTNPPLSDKELRRRAYLDAVKRLETVPAAFVGITGISYGDPYFVEVFDEAIDQVKRADVETGLRQLFLQTPVNMPPKRAELLSDQINHPFVSLINGAVAQALPDGSSRRQVGVVGYYLGLLATRPPHICPHAAYNGARISTIISSSAKYTKQYKTDITLGRVETIYTDNVLQTWKFLNGLTTSSEFSDRYVSVNRIRIQIISDLYVNLQVYRSQPNTPDVRGQVESAVSAYMNTKMQQGWIAQLGGIICNETNNSPSDIARGIINVSIAYLPVLPADFINVELIEDYTLIDTLALVPNS